MPTSAPSTIRGLGWRPKSQAVILPAHVGGAGSIPLRTLREHIRGTPEAFDRPSDPIARSVPVGGDHAGVIWSRLPEDADGA